MIRHLYVHIPFCASVCPYCSFYKEVTGRNNTPEFTRALLLEAERFAGDLRPRTVFFGGGTPSILPVGQLRELLGGLRERIDFSEVAEWTFEMNPATVSAQKAGLLLEMGVNRASMGVQAWQDGVLRTLGRAHDRAAAEQSFRILREAGFVNINLDLMFGVPGQSEDDWLESLQKTVDLAPEHVSAYCLTYEEDTPFFESLGRGEIQADVETDARFFEMGGEFLAGAGYEAYEISNFAREGARCGHNLAYWCGEDYIGLGPSAFSTHGRRRWRNACDTRAYVRAVLSGGSPVDFVEDTPPEVRLRESLAFGLRTSDGAPSAHLDKEELARLDVAGFVEVDGGRCRLTRRGRLLADEIAAALIP